MPPLTTPAIRCYTERIISELNQYTAMTYVIISQETVSYVAGKMGEDKSNVQQIANAYSTAYSSHFSLEYRLGMFFTHFAFTCPTRRLAQ